MNRNTMTHIALDLPPYIENALQKLITAGIIANRSEGIRNALRDFFKSEIPFLNKLGEFMHESGNELANKFDCRIALERRAQQ